MQIFNFIVINALIFLSISTTSTFSYKRQLQLQPRFKRFNPLSVTPQKVVQRQSTALNSVSPSQYLPQKLSDLDQEVLLIVCAKAYEVIDFALKPTINPAIFNDLQVKIPLLLEDISKIRKKQILFELHKKIVSKMASENLDLYQMSLYEQLIKAIIFAQVKLRPKTPEFVKLFVSEMTDFQLTIVDEFAAMLRTKNYHSETTKQLCIQLCMLLEKVG
jgi:hypothetical protein